MAEARVSTRTSCFLHGQCCEDHPEPAAVCLGSDFIHTIFLIGKSQRLLQREVNENAYVLAQLGKLRHRSAVMS